MTIALILPLACLIFNTLLLVVYFSKRRMPNYENKIYRAIIIINFLLLIMEFVNTYAFHHMSNTFCVVMVKLYLLLLSGYILLMSLYISYVSKDEYTIKEKWDKVKLFYFILFLVTVFISLRGAVNFCVSELGATAYGACPLTVYAFYFICFIFWIYNFLRNRNVNKTKYIPFIIFMISSLLVSIIQYKNPGLLLITPLETLITFIMYFTIENPDMQMVEKLNEAKDTAEVANRAKTDFLSSMSHEIRTPLNSIVGFSDCVCRAKNLDEAKENAKDIMDASSVLVEIVDGILDISKLESGKLELNNSSYNAKQKFDVLAQDYVAKSKEKGLLFL